MQFISLFGRRRPGRRRLYIGRVSDRTYEVGMNVSCWDGRRLPNMVRCSGFSYDALLFTVPAVNVHILLGSFPIGQVHTLNISTGTEDLSPLGKRWVADDFDVSRPGKGG